MPDTIAQLLDDHFRRQQQQQPGLQANQALDNLLAPGGVRGGEGPPGVAARGDGGGAQAFNTSMPTMDIWNGNQGTRSFASGAPAVALDAMRGAIDPGYAPFSGAGPGSTGPSVSTGSGNPNQSATDMLDRLTQSTVNSLSGGRLNPHFEAALANTQNTLAPILGNQTAANRLSLDQLIQQGQTASNGTRIPGAIENDATRSHAALLMAQNAPRAEDVAADQGAERRIEQLRANGMSEETAAGVMRRAGERLPRRLGGTGGNMQSGSNANPPWMGGPHNPPAQPTPGGPPLPTTAVNPAPGSPAPPVGGPMRVIDQAFDIGNQIIPTVAGPNGQQTRVPYSENPTAYHNAITQVLQNIPDDANLRQNFPAIQQRMLEQFGGTQALDTWINQMTSPMSRMFSGQGTRDQQAQIRRILSLANMRQTPINMQSRGLTTPQIIGSALTAPSLGQ